jgi:hypothetical protein
VISTSVSRRETLSRWNITSASEAGAHSGHRKEGRNTHADAFRPDASGKFPVLLVRTPYDKRAAMALTEKDFFPQRG